MKASKIIRSAIEPWLWWATFVVARASGSGPQAAYKAAQRVTAKLHA
jgi:hypothetical protein